MPSRQAFLQRVAASLIIPITLLPLAAVLLAVGTQLGVEPVEAAGLALIRFWLPLFYGMGISIGFTDSDGMAALSVAAGFLVMSATAEAVAGDPTLNLGVLGGIVAGAVCTWIFIKVKDLALPEYLALFSGKRIGPIASAGAGLLMGYLFGYFWPPIQSGIIALGEWMYGAGGVGVFAYGSVLRLLIPTGLHHILMQFVDTQLGGWIDPVSGRMVAGEYLRFLAGDPAAGRLLSGFFLTLGFGPLGAAMAITREALPQQRRKVAGLMVTGVLTAMILGVTEPVEFAFIFASPVLFGLHILFAGFASLAAWLFEIHLGGYALPMALINSALPNARGGLLLIPLGLAYTALYYYSFRAVIRRLRPPILGQVPEAAATDEESTVAAAQGSQSVPNQVDGRGKEADSEAAGLLWAMGGRANLRRLDACMTRLRVTVADPAAVDDGKLRRLGASAVIHSGSDIQVVVGTRAGGLAVQIRSLLADTRGVGADSAGPTTPTHRSGSADGSGSGAITVVSPLTGSVVPLAMVPDPIFAAGTVGMGVAVEPTDGQILAPVSGQVVTIFPGGHAMGFITPEGMEVLIHVGLETVALKGEGFRITINEGDTVTAGAPIGRCDLSLLSARGKALVTPVLVTSLDWVGSMEPLASGPVQAGEPLLIVRPKGGARPQA